MANACLLEGTDLHGRQIKVRGGDCLGSERGGGRVSGGVVGGVAGGCLEGGWAGVGWGGGCVERWWAGVGWVSGGVVGRGCRSRGWVRERGWNTRAGRGRGLPHAWGTALADAVWLRRRMSLWPLASHHAGSRPSTHTWQWPFLPSRLRRPAPVAQAQVSPKRTNVPGMKHRGRGRGRGRGGAGFYGMMPPPFMPFMVPYGYGWVPGRGAGRGGAGPAGGPRPAHEAAGWQAQLPI